MNVTENKLPALSQEYLQVLDHISRIHRTGMWIYLFLLLLFAGFAVSLFFVKVDPGVRARGYIRPLCEKTEIKSLAPARVSKIMVSPGDQVRKMDTILLFDQDKNLNSLENQQLLHRRLIAEQKDLNILINNRDQSLSSDRYLLESEEYKRKLSKKQKELLRAYHELKRIQPLYFEQLIPEKEFQDQQFRVAILENELKTVSALQMASWQRDLERVKTRMIEIKEQMNSLEEQKSFFTLTAPVSGTIESLTVYEGTLVNTGQVVCQISPDTTLIAECYLSPAFIGKIREGMECRLAVDAYNHHEWGCLDGRIHEISSDIHVIGQQPVYIIKCSLSKEHLELKNGIRAALKKGMSIECRFLAGKHTLFQLLLQKYGDLLKPRHENS